MGVRLTKLRRGILETISERPSTTDELVERLYGDETGGPVSAHKVIHVVVHKMRRAGVPIVTAVNGASRARYGIAEEAIDDVRCLLAGKQT